MVLYGLRPAVLIGGFKRKIDWKPGKDIPRDIVRGLRAYRNDGLFASLSDNLALNFFEVYMVAVGGGNREVGAMAAIANLLGFLALAPGVAAVRLLGRRRPVVLIGGGGIGRLMYLGLALVPFLFPDPHLAIPAVIVFNGIRVFMGNFSNPAWTNMTADLVPERVRGSYFASRNAYIAVAATIATLGSGWIVGRGNALPWHPLLGYTALFGVTFAVGMISTYFFSKVPDLCGNSIARERRPLADLVRGFLGYPAFLGFLAFTFLWNFALQIAGPFFNVYMVRDLGSPMFMVGLVAAAGSISQVFALPFWGRYVDRRGDLRGLVWTGVLIPFLPLAWVFTTETWQPALINLASGFLWAGFNLANFNLLLKMIPASDRQEGAAIYQALVLLSTVLGPVVGAEISINMGYKGAFIASAICRYVALVALYFLMIRRLRKP
jgi:MFS family permease